MKNNLYMDIINQWQKIFLVIQEVAAITKKRVSLEEMNNIIYNKCKERNFLIPKRQLNSLIRKAFDDKMEFNYGAIFDTIGPEPSNYGVGMNSDGYETTFPPYFEFEFTQEQLDAWKPVVDALNNVQWSEQRSPEWFNQRNNSITASDFSAAVGEDKYSTPEELLLKKCGLGETFNGNKFTRHGVIFEDCAIAIYEKMYKTKVFDFGLVSHGCAGNHSRGETINYIAASPDGINELGVMLEIKCPIPRKPVHHNPNKHGDTSGDKDIVPHGYYCQIQSQLECTDLDVCDFLECVIIQYDNEDAYREDIGECNYKTKEGKIKSLVMQFHEVDNLDDDDAFKIEYPDDIYMTKEQESTWITNTIQKYTNNPKYGFKKIIYYWHKDIAVFRVYRDRQFFDERLVKAKAFWEKVVECRSDSTKIPDVKKKKPRYERNPVYDPNECLI